MREWASPEGSTDVRPQRPLHDRKKKKWGNIRLRVNTRCMDTGLRKRNAPCVALRTRYTTTHHRKKLTDQGTMALEESRVPCSVLDRYISHELLCHASRWTEKHKREGKGTSGRTHDPAHPLAQRPKGVHTRTLMAKQVRLCRG
jgi:hypothetical protein